MYKNTPHALRALVLGTLLTTTGLGFASANTTTTTHAPATTVEATKMETTKAPMAKTDATKMETTKTEAANVKSTNTASPAIVNTSIGLKILKESAPTSLQMCLVIFGQLTRLAL